MKKYRTVFIGNRPLILSGLIKHPQIDLVQAFVMQGSLIDVDGCSGIPVTVCEPKDSNAVLDFLNNGDYEICASAGCPFILPISSLPEKVYINSHPSALPHGKGIHPINECIFSNHKKAGSTLHYLVDKLDAGDIIHQITFDMTDDIDLDLLYSFIFDLEAEVFFEGLSKILSGNLIYKGTPQQGDGTYYSRKSNDLSVDLSCISVDIFLKKVRAFSSDALGVRINLVDKNIIVFKASIIYNEFILNRFKQSSPGDLLISNNNFLLLRLIDGIVKIDKWVS